MQLVKKYFKYRGMELEDLKKLDVRELAKYLPARQRRAVLRQFGTIEDFVNMAKTKIAKDKQIKTHKRAIIIVPQMVGMKIGVHSGKGFVPVTIITEMIGHRLGEFSPTRAKIKHGKAGIGSTKGSKHKSKK
jgi:small subunit ribosomal protein S19